MQKPVKYFLQGLLLIAPLAITGYIILAIFNLLDGLLKETLGNVIGIEIPGLGLVIIVLFLMLVGWLGSTFIAQPMKKFLRAFIESIPLLDDIYTAIRDLFSAFVGEQKKFSKPVLVLINPDAKLEKLGFLTEQDLSKLGEPGKVAVYFPHSYNFSGELFVVPKEHVKSIAMDPTDVMKFIVSGGVSGISG
jgi:uncharacterized membrane protein